MKCGLDLETYLVECIGGLKNVESIKRDPDDTTFTVKFFDGNLFQIDIKQILKGRR